MSRKSALNGCKAVFALRLCLSTPLVPNSETVKPFAPAIEPAKACCVNSSFCQSSV